MLNVILVSILYLLQLPALVQDEECVAHDSFPQVIMLLPCLLQCSWAWGSLY